MDIAFVGLQNAGKTSLLRVLSVRIAPKLFAALVTLTNAIAGRRVHDRVSPYLLESGR